MKNLALALTLAISSVIAVPAMSRASSVPACLGPSNPNGSPPAGFSPLQASDAQLACYGFPRRPTTPAALARWTNAMQHATHWMPGHAINDPNAPTYSTFVSNWGGYVAMASANGFSQITEADAGWIEQAKKNTDYHHIGDWAGVGGSSTAYPLIQAGTQLYDAPTASHAFWYENVWYINGVYQCCASVPVSSPTIAAGQNAYVAVWYNTGVAYYFLENLTTNTYHEYSQTTSHFSSSSAEAIVEDANGSSGYTSYNGVNFTESEAVNGAGTTYWFNQLAVNKYIMGGSAYLSPGPLGSGGTFTLCANC